MAISYRDVVLSLFQFQCSDALMQASEPCLVKIKELKANMSVEVISVPSTAIGSRESTFFERGDAPAQAVIHANAQARSLRKAAETQEELREVSDRVSQVTLVVSLFLGIEN